MLSTSAYITNQRLSCLGFLSMQAVYEETLFACKQKTSKLTKRHDRAISFGERAKMQNEDEESFEMSILKLKSELLEFHFSCTFLIGLFAFWPYSESTCDFEHSSRKHKSFAYRGMIRKSFSRFVSLLPPRKTIQIVIYYALLYLMCAPSPTFCLCASSSGGKLLFLNEMQDTKNPAIEHFSPLLGFAIVCISRPVSR